MSRLLYLLTFWCLGATATLTAGVGEAAYERGDYVGALQAWRGSHIVITTIMFNYIAAAFIVYMLVDVMRPAGQMDPASARFPAGAKLPALSDMPFLREFFAKLNPDGTRQLSGSEPIPTYSNTEITQHLSTILQNQRLIFI